MDIQKLCNMQEELDNKIIADKGIIWTEDERFLNTLVALDVELAEFANEARWFKRWSKNQKPKTKVENLCTTCNGSGDENVDNLTENLAGGYTHEVVPCEDCNATGSLGFRNPLLEEFADAVHFFLSIANQKGWHEELYLYEESILDLEESGFDGGLNGIYLEMKFNLSKLLETNKEDFFLGKSSYEFDFRSAWFCFIAIGMIGFNFTWEDIEEAYLTKHKTNHDRQANGY